MLRAYIFNSCIQNNYTIASIFDHLFRTIKIEYPLINIAYIRSDNAGCYHNGPLLLSLPEIGKRNGITVARYDFSEPQTGKDICDRKIAPMKAHIRRYVNENHDVVSAEDMKLALKSHGGLKGCRAAVVEVDSSKDLNESNKRPDISLLYNFQYETSGIRVWKAYEVGKGKLLTYKDHQIQPQQVASLKVVKPFGPRQKERGFISNASRVTQAEIFSCSETTCILTFSSESEAQAHMDTGKHCRELESVSLYDEIRKKWAEKVTGINTVAKPTPNVSTPAEVGESRVPDAVCSMGWALKTTKKKTRFGEKVRGYLIEKFQAGEISGTKADPQTVSREMKFKKDANGKLFFLPDEWKTPQQIKSFFSRHSATLRQQQIGVVGVENDTEQELMEEDMEAWETEATRQDLREAISSQMRQEHPIQVGEINICDLSLAGKLQNLKITQPKAVSGELGLDIQGSQARKK